MFFRLRGKINLSDGDGSKVRVLEMVLEMVKEMVLKEEFELFAKANNPWNFRNPEY